jgi:hypothetical protein
MKSAHLDQDHSLKNRLDLGWSVQIYSSDRRLLCSLEPSHAWGFLVGISVGVVLALVGTQHLHTQPQTSTTTTPSTTTIPEALLHLD